jgi:hypothetical protein
MNTRTASLILTLLLLAWSFFGCNVANTAVARSSTISVVIELDSTTFLRGENTIVGIDIKNLSDDNINMRYPFQTFAGLRFRITDANGNVYSYKGDEPSDGGGGRMTLRPKEEMYSLYSLTSWYGVRPNGIRNSGFFPDGIYDVVAIVSPDYDPDHALQSNHLQISIRIPEGDEIEAESMLNNGQREFEMEQPKGEKSEAILRSLCSTFPMSPFRPSALILIQTIRSWSNDSLGVRQIAMNLADEYPNTLIAAAAVKTPLTKMPKEQRKEYLEQVASKHKGTKVEISAHHTLDAMSRHE